MWRPLYEKCPLNDLGFISEHSKLFTPCTEWFSLQTSFLSPCVRFNTTKTTCTEKKLLELREFDSRVREKGSSIQKKNTVVAVKERHEIWQMAHQTRLKPCALYHYVCKKKLCLLCLLDTKLNIVHLMSTLHPRTQTVRQEEPQDTHLGLQH